LEEKNFIFQEQCFLERTYSYWTIIICDNENEIWKTIIMRYEKNNYSKFKKFLLTRDNKMSYLFSSIDQNVGFV